MESEEINYVPANMPGCQMMSNLNYIPATAFGFTGENLNYVPAGTPETGRWKLAYVPAPFSTAPGADPPNKPNFKLSWWEENSFFKYPYLLISAFYGMKWKDNFREYFNIPDDFIIIGDSGGFQNLTMDANLDPIEVLRWQEKHCQIGLTFDEPTLGSDSNALKKQKQINTVSNAYLALNNRKEEKLKLFAVVQGHSVDEQKFIFDEYKKRGDISKFDGFAMGGIVAIAGNVSLLTKVLITFLENVKEYNKPVHFFGISGANVIPIIIKLQKKYNIPITFDSSSYGGGAIRKEFWLDNAKTKISFTKDGNTLKTLPCNCPVCRVSTPETYFAEGSVSGGMIALHNLHETIQYVERLKSLGEDTNLFTTYVKKNCKEEVLKSFEIIDYLTENGFEKTMQKFDFVEGKSKGEQKGLF